MDKSLVAEKLETLRVVTARLKSKVPASPEALRHDADVQDIIIANLTRAVQICVDIAAHIVSNSELKPAATMAQAFDQLVTLGVIDEDLGLRMKKATGFRNVAVHAYDKVNWNIVYSILTVNLSDFSRFAAAIDAQLDS